MPSFQLSFQTNYRFAENICKPHIWYICLSRMGFPCSLVGKESACSAGDPGLMPGLGRSPGEGNGNPLQYPCLEKLTDRGAWWAAVRGSQRVGHNQAINPNSYLEYIRGFIGSSADKKKIHLQCRRPQLHSWVRKIPGEGDGYPLQCSCLENSTDRRAWWAAVHGVTKRWTELSNLLSEYIKNLWKFHGTSTAGSLGLIPGWESKIPQAT